ILDTELKQQAKKGLKRNNPFPGIKSVEVKQVDKDNLQITVEGDKNAPQGKISQRLNQGLTLNFQPRNKTEIAQLANQQEKVYQAQNKNILIPNPEVIIKSNNTTPNIPNSPQVKNPPRYLPRAIAPPVGDISVSNINSAPSTINLDSSITVPRLVLRDAPVREVIGLLARAAGLNVVYSDNDETNKVNKEQKELTISLDIENEPVDQVFNSVLLVTGLNANRRGNTIYVGKKLPDAARNLITRTFRLNQVKVDDAAAYLASQGAEVQLFFEGGERLVRENVGTADEPIIRTFSEPTPPKFVPLTPQRDQTSRELQSIQPAPLLLRGLLAASDKRLNSLTLIGEPEKVQLATSLLVQLDARRRQVAVNVKVIDVNLLGTEAFNSSFSFGVGDTFFVQDNGAAVVNFGGINPPGAIQTANGIVTPPIVNNPYSNAQIFLDPNSSTFSVPGTVPGTVRINEDTGSSAVPTFSRESTRGKGNFFQPFITLDSPTKVGLTDFELATDNIITTTADGVNVTQGQNGTVTFGLPNLFQFPKRFLSTLQAQITSGNAKILTDPTLVVQEGEVAEVKLTQQVVGNIISETETTDGLTTRTVTAEIEDAGLTLAVDVQRIDDNGFITMNVDPTVTSIGAVQELDVGGDENRIALLNVRSLNSGKIRLRDGQTLILSGIIQESDRTTVSKVPILGDLPIIGALFRSTNRDKQRNEVIVLVTPQIVDEGSDFGYQYNPGRETGKYLQQQGFTVPVNR
ncbi:MAG: hypothetical protein D6756_04755, partial [Cyanobacteria bacterium J083]